jgi:hypothetical protein
MSTLAAAAPNPTTIGTNFVGDLGPQVVNTVTGVLPAIAPYALGLTVIYGIWARFMGRKKQNARV